MQDREEETVTGEVLHEAYAGLDKGAVQMTSVDFDDRQSWTEMHLEEGTYKLVRVDND